VAVGIEHVNDYTMIRFEIQFERKFPIRRSYRMYIITDVRLRWTVQ